MSYDSPCDVCGQRPATHGYYCHVCRPSQRKRDMERLGIRADEEYDRRKDEGELREW